MMMIIIIIIINILIWCALGYAGGWIAARKGYPPRLGVVVAILFGPIALVVCALLPATKEGREQEDIERQLNAEAMEFAIRRNCANCGREVSARAPACPRCDHR